MDNLKSLIKPVFVNLFAYNTVLDILPNCTLSCTAVIIKAIVASHKFDSERDGYLKWHKSCSGYRLYNSCVFHVLASCFFACGSVLSVFIAGSLYFIRM